MKTSKFTRRRFLGTGAAALGMAPLYLKAQGTSPNEKIAIGVIGCGGMGTGNMKNFLNIEECRVVAVCDVDSGMMGRAKRTVDEFYGNGDCREYGAYTDLLQHPELDAVLLGTPDHWHARIGIDASRAGLDIYGEKPFAWGLLEGRQLLYTLKKNNTVWQTGSWQRSKGEFRRFKALIENDTLGKITRFECGTPSGMSVKKTRERDSPPKELDWEKYCGPAGSVDYHWRIHPFNWRWLNEFGGGQLMDWVGHHVDIAMWSLGLDKTGPVKVEGSGKPGDDELFNTYVEYAYKGTFADGRVMEVRSDFMGTKFTGENGWISVNRGKLRASDRELLRNLPDDFDTKPPTHYQDFINCVRSRETPQSDAEGAHRAASFGQLAIVAMDTGRPVRWDPKKEQVVGDSEQAKHPRLGSRVKA